MVANGIGAAQLDGTGFGWADSGGRGVTVVDRDGRKP